MTWNDPHSVLKLMNYEVPRIIEKAQRMDGVIWGFHNIFFLITMFSFDNFSDV